MYHNETTENNMTKSADVLILTGLLGIAIGFGFAKVIGNGDPMLTLAITKLEEKISSKGCPNTNDIATAVAEKIKSLPSTASAGITAAPAVGASTPGPAKDQFPTKQLLGVKILRKNQNDLEILSSGTLYKVLVDSKTHVVKRKLLPEAERKKAINKYQAIPPSERKELPKLHSTESEIGFGELKDGDTVSVFPRDPNMPTTFTANLIAKLVD